MSDARISVNGEMVSIAEARVLLGVPDEWCFGCYLGDDGPAAHDLCDLSEWEDQCECPVCHHGEIGYDTDENDGRGGLNCNECWTVFTDGPGGSLVPVRR